MGLLHDLGLRKRKSYWERRKNKNYLREVFHLSQEIAPDAKSIIDVGSNKCEYLEWFEWIPNRVCVDLETPYSSETVDGIKADFLVWQNKQLYDLCLCLQVLEHIPEAEAFAQKLLRTSPNVIISVPYKWPQDKIADHVHDPVDEAKVQGWFGKPAEYSKLVRDGKSERLICYFTH